MLAIIIGLAVAALVGYLAGQLMGLKTEWYINIILGLIGGAVGTAVFKIIGISASNIIGGVLIDTAGACLVIFLYNKFIRK